MAAHVQRLLKALLCAVGDEKRVGELGGVDGGRTNGYSAREGLSGDGVVAILQSDR